MAEDTIRSTIVSVIIDMIMKPLALALSFISLISALIFLNMGAWITSIPFVLSTVFGIYFVYLNRPGTDRGG